MPPNALALLPDWQAAAPLQGLRSNSEPYKLIDLNIPQAPPPLSPTIEPERMTVGMPSAPTFFHIPQADKLEGALFKNRADLKLMTSRVAMHLSADQRRSLFSELDRLLDIAHWEDESSQIDTEAFRSYLRFTIYGRPRKLPNLGVSPDGAFLAAWRHQRKSVHVEFFRADQCMALIKTISERGPETAVWRGHVARLRDAISNNGAGDCID
jgi:hypothetical protein